MNSSLFHIPRPAMSRRSFLRAAGVSLSLPLLEAMSPTFGRAADPAKAPPRRMLAIEANQGILPQNFFPKQAGKDYEPSPYLKLLANHRKDFTVFSGTSHPGVDGGHDAEVCFLTGAPHPMSGGFRNTVSLDQFAAEQIGTRTRFPSFTVAVGPTQKSLSYTRNGVCIPGEQSPATLYRQMFLQGNAEQVQKRVRELQEGRSILDFVNDRAKKMERDLGAKDRERLDQYFSSVRDLEKQFVESEAWEGKPKPKTQTPAPNDIDIRDHSQLLARIQQMFGILRLALETDSTRLITVFLSFTAQLKLSGVTEDTHTLTHHGGRPEAIAQLERIEAAAITQLSGLLTSLKEIREQDSTLLDRTMVLYGTCMGDANTHNNNNLPMLLAGGGFKHGQHLAFDTKNNYPLPNLFVSMLQRLGIESEKFATSTGTMRGLEMV